MNRERLSTIRLPSHKRSFVKSVLATMRERGGEGRRPAKASLTAEVPAPEQIQQTAHELGMPLREDSRESGEPTEIHRQAEAEVPAQERLGKSAVRSALDQSAEAAA